MGSTALPTPREIARLIPQCPSCEGDSYLAVLDNRETGFVLQALRCEMCEEDILGFFLRLPPAVRASLPEAPTPRSLATSLSIACIGTMAIIGWLVLAEFG
jgi:hypothetical protein